VDACSHLAADAGGSPRRHATHSESQDLGGRQAGDQIDLRECTSTSRAEVTPPVVGLVRQLSERIDLDILTATVDAGFSLRIVGPRDQRWEPQLFAVLIVQLRVHHAGAVPAGCALLPRCDRCGYYPVRDNPFNRASLRLKTLEHLGAGRPVVSTDSPATQWLSDDLARSEQTIFREQILAIADSLGEFIAAIRRMAGDPSSSADASRAAGPASAIAGHYGAFAARYAWSRRVEAFAAAIASPWQPREYTNLLLVGANCEDTRVPPRNGDRRLTAQRH
jgi:hypothetical protein